MTDKQKFYEYDQLGSGSWWVKTPPVAEPWFQAELNLAAGYSDRGQPNLRVVWGGTALSDITEKPQLKYKVTREIISGFTYVKEDGELGTTKSMNLPKDAKVPWEFYPQKRQIELGRLRWVIEKHVSADELAKLGRFRNRRATDGELILRELPPEGVYDHFFWVQTANHKYRDLDNEVLTAVIAMHQYNLNTSEAQKVLDDRERANSNILTDGHEFNEIFQQVSQ